MAQLNAPIILFCSERSGSNLIAKMFDAHPKVCAPGASHLFKVMGACACRYTFGSDDLRRAVLTLFETKVSHWAIDDWPAERRWALLEGLNHAGEMAAALYAAEARLAGKAHTFLKENVAFRYLPMLEGQSQNARYLFMVRDPRDMAVSWVNGPVMRGGILRASERWCSDQAGYLQAIAQLPSEARMAFLRYEDLLVAPEEELRRVCEELDLGFSPEMLSFSERSASARLDAKRSAMWSNLDKPLLEGNANKFLNELSDNEIAYTEAVAGPLMSELGYVTARHGKPPFGAFASLEDLRADLAEREPYEKPAYLRLPIDERSRFEAWSRLSAEMHARPVLAPAKLTTTEP